MQPSRVSVGLGLYTGQRPEGVAGPRFADAPVLAAAAEAAGFDSFWVSEHHAHDDGYLPSPLPVLAACSVTTSRIALGTGVLLGALHDPVRLASDTVVVDHLTGGRLILGLGLGYVDEEYRAFDVDRSTRGVRLQEVIDVLRLAWTGERFSYPGRIFDLHHIRVTPRPLRSTGIPVWLGGYAQPALKRAALAADGHLIGRGSEEIIERSQAEIALERRQRLLSAPFTMAVNLAMVLDTPEGHPESARAAFTAQQVGYERIQRGKDVYAGLVADSQDSDLALGSISAYLQADGPAESVVAAIDAVSSRLAGWSAVHVVLRAIFPEARTDWQLDRIAALGRDVLPFVNRS